MTETFQKQNGLLVLAKRVNKRPGYFRRFVSYEKYRTKYKNDQQDFLGGLLQTLQKQEKPGLSQILESLLNALMVRERESVLEKNPKEQANGFYSRNLHLSLDKLNLKIPRVRSGAIRFDLQSYQKNGNVLIKIMKNE